ncbi:MAG: hypothetical protein HDS65_02720 [Bacteroidales bacterium]|nr:hypothetical protein [Bacteroidales bacterium]
MKKLYSLLLAAVLGASISQPTFATDVTVKWETPGAVRIAQDSNRGTQLPIPADATEYVLTNIEDEWYYIQAGDGFKLVGASSPGGDWKGNLITWTTPNYIQVLKDPTYLGRDKVIFVDCQGGARNETFTITVDGEASKVDCRFTSTENWKVELKDGENTVKFSSAIDKTFYIFPTTGNDLASCTLNGTPLEKTGAGFNPLTPKAGDVYVVTTPKADETYPLTIDAPEGCIASIYCGKFYWPPFEGLEFPKGVTLKVNLDTKEWTYSSVKVGSDDYTSAAANFGSVSIPFEGATTLTIKASAKSYSTTNFTVYAENMEGVVLKAAILMNDEGEIVNPGTGATVTTTLPSNLSGGYKMDAAATKKYTVPVSDKYGKLWVSPAEGWYIQTVQVRDEGQYGTAGTILKDYASASYIIAKKFEYDGEITVNVIGDKSCSLTPSNPDYDAWQNPRQNLAIKTGTQTLKIVKGLDTYSGNIEFNAKILGATETDQIYLNGQPCEQVYNSDAGQYIAGSYTFKYTDSDYTPIVTIYSAAGAPQIGYLTIEGDDAAKILSTPLAPTGTYSTAFFTAGAVEVQLSNAKASATLNGTPVTPDADGKLTLTLGAGSNTLKIEVAVDYAQYTGIEPEAGSTIKSLTSFKLFLLYDEESGFNPMIDEDLLGKITLTKGATTITGATTEYIDIDYDKTTWQPKSFYATFTLSEAATEAGEWTLSIPAGLIYTGSYDEEAETTLHNGETYGPLSVKYTIDPNAKTKLDYYTFDPAAGSEVEELEIIHLAFTKYSQMQAMQYPRTVTLTNGDTTVEAEVYNDYDNDQYCGFIFELPSIITEAGEWTLSIPEGAFAAEDLTSQAITASWTIAPATPPTPYHLDPANGVVTRSATGTKPNVVFTIYFDVTGTMTTPDYTKITMICDGEVVPKALSGNLYYAASFNAGSKFIKFTVNNTELKSGQIIEVAFDEGAFTYGGEPNTKLSFQYTVNAYEPVTEFDGQETVDWLGSISVYYPTAKTIAAGSVANVKLRYSTMSEYNMSPSSFEYFNADDEVQSDVMLMAEPVSDLGGAGVKLTFDPAPTAKGEYTLALPANAFTLDGSYKTPLANLKFALDVPTGVEGISTEAAEGAIFNLQGIRIDSEWSELAPGIYIRGGKKVLKK